MNVWSICVSISVTITDTWTKFGTEHKYHTINTPLWPNSHKLKIHLEFRKNVNNFGLDEGILHQISLYGKMHHDHAEMTAWSKVERQNLVGSWITAMWWHMTKTRNRNCFCVTLLLWWIKMYILNEYREHNNMRWCQGLQDKSSQLSNLYF